MFGGQRNLTKGAPVSFAIEDWQIQEATKSAEST